ncbi:MAG: ArsR family transcriptional regulator [Halomonadaceae bacterium]|nr:MAG: ArsR family transcriptional regulator [Halomonadaceae bacterium]
MHLLALEPVRLLKCLADDTRLMVALLVFRQGELCVCELTHALDASQPKISRHLAQLRSCGLLSDRRQGQWVYYDLAPALPAWVRDILAACAEGEALRLEALQAQLCDMENRPNQQCA